MPQEFLIIDGYNLMHAAGLARARYGPGDLARRRHRLLQRLKTILSEQQRRRTTVVFDAWEPPPEGNRLEKVAGMTVQFAAAPGEADAVIEELIAKHSAPKQLTVISGDRRLQQAAARRKAQAVDSETWLARQTRAQPPSDAEPPPTAKRGGALSEAEVEYWLDVFSDVDDPAAEPNETPSRDLPDVIDEDEFE